MPDDICPFGYRAMEPDEKIEPGDIFYGEDPPGDPAQFHQSLSFGFCPRDSVHHYKYFRLVPESVYLNEDERNELEKINIGLFRLLVLARRKHRWVEQMNNGVAHLLELAAAEAYWQARVDGAERKTRLKAIRLASELAIMPHDWRRLASHKAAKT
jgi:hypothetical protein